VDHLVLDSQIFFFPVLLEASFTHKHWVLAKRGAWSIILLYEVACPCMMLKRFQFTIRLK